MCGVRLGCSLARNRWLLWMRMRHTSQDPRHSPSVVVFIYYTKTIIAMKARVHLVYKIRLSCYMSRLLREGLLPSLPRLLMIAVNTHLTEKTHLIQKALNGQASIYHVTSEHCCFIPYHSFSFPSSILPVLNIYMQSSDNVSSSQNQSNIIHFVPAFLFTGSSTSLIHARDFHGKANNIDNLVSTKHFVFPSISRLVIHNTT